MVVLLYNWVPFTDLSKGGGVTVYLKRLVARLCKEQDVELCFLCAGKHYDVTNRALRYEKLNLGDDEECRMYTIVNSPVFAPAYLSFFYVETVFKDRDLRGVFQDFLLKEGPFDVVHFHNLEGLSLDVLECRHQFPMTKFIYSIHNYYAFCPQVNLWICNKTSCALPDTGAWCIDCMEAHVPKEKLWQKMAIDYLLLQRGDTTQTYSYYEKKREELDRLYAAEENRGLTEDEKNALASVLSLYRKRFVESLNRNMDLMPAVSERTLELAEGFGIEGKKLRLSYIGTETADRTEMREISDKETLSLIYMGYQRYDKGFFFLIDVLNSLEPKYAKRIDLTIAAKQDKDGDRGWQIAEGNFHTYIYQNGYERGEIDGLLKRQDLGIVPVLWEDNLPQVALEMAAHGVAVMCSDRGGAKELCDSDLFCFRAGDVEDCRGHICKLLDNPGLLGEYHRHFKGLKSMDSHIEELLQYYRYG